MDGIQELQFRFRIKEPDGNTMRPALRFLANLQHGKTGDDYSRHSLNRYGWYTNAAYAYARLHSPVPTAPVSGSGPSTPASSRRPRAYR